MKIFSKRNTINTIKIVGAAVVAIIIATFLELDFAVSTGIVAILTIQPTKQETLKMAAGRFAAFVSALIIAYACFMMFGYGNTGFFAYLLIFIFVCQVFHWYGAMAMNSVLISHFITLGNMGGQALLNEVSIFCIGVGLGILVNMHLHKDVDHMKVLKQNTDNQIRKILRRMSERILNKDMSDYNGECFEILEEYIRNAKNVAKENYDNQLDVNDTYDTDYIKMRKAQCGVLYEMYKSVRYMDTTPVTAKKISEFLREISEVYHEDNTAEELMTKFKELDEDMKNHPLPVERKEFEDRARLYILLRYIEEFLEIKKNFANRIKKC